jgi:hypothetical protein
MYELKNLYLQINLLGPGPLSYKKRINRAAVSQRLGNTALGYVPKTLTYQQLCGSLKSHRNAYVATSYSNKIHCKGSLHHAQLIWKPSLTVSDNGVTKT